MGFNIPAIREKLGIPYSLVAGLTRSTLLEPGQPHSIADVRLCGLEAEVAVRLASTVTAETSVAEVEGAIDRWAPAIEVVHFHRPLSELEAILAEGIFHRALVLGQWVAPKRRFKLTRVRATVRRNDEIIRDVDAEEATGEAAPLIAHVARLLAEYGERLERGDVVILGSMNLVTLAKPHTTFSLELEGAGSVSLRLIP